MISRAAPAFWRAYDNLNDSERESARHAFRLFSANSGHNSLKFKKLRGHANVWSVRVTLNIRAVGYREGDTIEWLWIGTHNEFDKLSADHRSPITVHCLARHSPATAGTAAGSLMTRFTLAAVPLSRFPSEKVSVNLPV